jgi:tyrosine-protein phosphatase SIW14
MANRIFALLAVITVACSLSIAAARAEVTKADIPGITNFSIIEGAPGFAGYLAGFGGATLPAAMPALKSAGFATVINLRLADEDDVDIDASRAAAGAAELQYIHLPFDAEKPDLSVVEAFLATVRDKANQPVYIHCNSATRAGALWMIGRVLEDGWEADAASKEVELISAKPEKAIAFATLYIASQQK